MTEHIGDRRRVDALLDEMSSLYDEIAKLKARVREQDSEIALLFELAAKDDDEDS